MKNNLYGDFNVPASAEQHIRRVIKGIINSTPPNTTTLNRKATAHLPRYFSNSYDTIHYMLIDAGIEVKNRQIRGQAGKLYLEFIQLADGTYNYSKYYVDTDWHSLYAQLVKEYNLSLEYFIDTVDAEATKLEQAKQAAREENRNNMQEAGTSVEQQVTDSAAALVEQVVSAVDPIDSKSTLKDYYEEHKEEVDANTTEIEDIVTATEENDSNSSCTADNNTLLDAETISDAIEELPADTDISTYLSNIMTSFRADNVMPPISVFYACIKQNGIEIDANLMTRLISRVVFVEWTDWLYNKITTTNQLTHSGKILIDTGFIKADGQVLYSIVDVRDNYPRYLKLDCSLVDIKAAGLDKSAARNQLTLAKKRLANNPITMDNIDFGTNKWKTHILDNRQSRFAAYRNLDYDARMSMVLESIKHACLLEEHGVSVKRLVRGSSTHVSVAIPLRYKNARQTSTAIILSLNRFGVWEIATIETGKELTNNIKAYNYYDMPSWLREVN